MKDPSALRALFAHIWVDFDKNTAQLTGTFFDRSQGSLDRVGVSPVDGGSFGDIADPQRRKRGAPEQLEGCAAP